jgi:hypothetical protein
MLHNIPEERRSLLHLMLAYEVPGERFLGLEEVDIEEGLNSHTAELTNGQDAEHLQGLSEPQGEKGCDAVVERPRLITSALKKGHPPDGR